MIEWVTVKGFDESLDVDDLWTESRYEVFRKVQEQTHSAMLHFFSPTLPDLAVKSYMVREQICLHLKAINVTKSPIYSRLGSTAITNYSQNLAEDAENTCIMHYHLLGETFGHWNRFTRSARTANNGR